MAVNFTAEQYDKPFIPHRLQNWQIPHKFPPKTPKSGNGFTQSIANDKGSLLPGQHRGNNSPWGTYVGTWDAPLRLPGPRQTNPTARSGDVAKKLVSQAEEANFVLSGRHKSLKERHPCAAVELPECYPRADKKRLLQAALCSRPPQGEEDAARKAMEFSKEFEAPPPPTPPVPCEFLNNNCENSARSMQGEQPQPEAN